MRGHRSWKAFLERHFNQSLFSINTDQGIYSGVNSERIFDLIDYYFNKKNILFPKHKMKRDNLMFLVNPNYIQVSVHTSLGDVELLKIFP